MTPREKAIELVDTFYSYVNCWGDDGEADYGMADRYAKECSLKVVNEILAIKFDDNITEYMVFDFHHYWQEVKQQIEKL